MLRLFNACNDDVTTDYCSKVAAEAASGAAFHDDEGAACAPCPPCARCAA